MYQPAQKQMELDGLSLALTRVERRLGWAMAVLLLGILGLLGGFFGQPVVQYFGGNELRVAAGVEGAGCGSHMEWVAETREISAGSRVEFANDTVYWQIQVQVERKQSDGSYQLVAESPGLRGGESWTHTFWRSGEYRIVSADQTQRLAGLETVISVQ